MYFTEADGGGRTALPGTFGHGERPVGLAAAIVGDHALLIDQRRGNARARPVLVRSNRPVLVVMARGTAVLSCGSFRAELSGARAALLARSGVATLDTSSDGLALAVSFDRAAFQRSASAALGVPHQLVAGNTTLLLPGAGALIVTMAEPADGELDSAPLITLLIAALDRASGEPRQLQRVESLIRAIARIEGDSESLHDGEEIARAAGLGLRSLRRAFRDVLGVSLGHHVHEVRLDRLRDSLTSGFETRAIRDIAAAAGFTSPTAFVKAYLRKFGETPSQTRARKAHENSRTF